MSSPNHYPPPKEPEREVERFISMDSDICLDQQGGYPTFIHQHSTEYCSEARRSGEHDHSKQSHRTRIQKANEEMDNYQKYVDEMSSRLPASFDRLNRFLKRGNCVCENCPCHAIHDDTCTCIQTTGGNCACRKEEETGEIPNPKKAPKKPKPPCKTCPALKLDDRVRVYTINPEKDEWDDFFDVKSYLASDQGEFEKLQDLLYTGDFDPVVGGLKEEAEPVIPSDSSNEPLPTKTCRLITVKHLSPRVAKLLGAKFKISADFFNRHLPGTEAISGRLISRLPSAVQIDFDELYESRVTFCELFPGAKVKNQDDLAMEGHTQIRQSMMQHLYFPVGWCHFPISQEGWLSSTKNVRLKSGYEVLLGEEGNKLRNVFQFNLNHRISIYSEPVGHPQTAIIIFYPTLPIHANELEKIRLDRNKKGLDFPIDQQPCECSLHGHIPSIRFRSIPNGIPTPDEWKRIQEDPDLSDWETQKRKQSYATAYDMVLKLQLKERLAERKDIRNKRAHNANHPTKAQDSCASEPKTSQFDSFIRVFGSPLFRLVSANWARLVVRRSFDLDLLEWRSKEVLSSITVEEIKSRRVAITRHLRDVGASLDILHALASAEKGKKPEDPESFPNTNIGRPNGFIATEREKDSWWSIYWDFFELRASLEALEKRADKIHDSIISMIGVFNMENSEKSNRHARTLNIIVGFVSFILIPFSIVPAVFQTLNIDHKGAGPNPSGRNFGTGMGVTVAAILLLIVIIGFSADVYGMNELRRPWVPTQISRLLHWLPKKCEKDPVVTLNDQYNKLLRTHSGEHKHWLRHRLRRWLDEETNPKTESLSTA